MTQTVLILGPSGKIGSHAAEAFWNAGWTVRRYDRTTDMTKAARGADVIVNGLNPPAYHNWAGLIPRITAQVIAAARASGATVIVPGNVYNFGNTPGPWSECTPQRPCTRKGQIRVEMENAYRASGVKTVILRAGNFIDPAHQGDIMSAFLMREIGKGKLARGGRADAVQPYCYVSDWARAAVMLAEKRDKLATFEDVPFPGHVFSANDLHMAMRDATGRDIRLVAFPWWLMSIASPVWELARELREMRYLWDLDHTLDGGKLARLLPDFHPTDLRTVMLAGLPADIHPDKVVRPGSKAVAAE
jgi:nucleoside-diphosphate-sugar epimerase